ncbi:unnamed protein product [Cyclocybe aegerita]|uniref:Peptidase S8/S53 domain-containing protein n=1 Tax=Cyclocybe aegerita TaxID=1973307 RepID=A0A8S0XI50_CYCAE|nr:unnamed protein product [Cyclocybe aegerita]
MTLQVPKEQRIFMHASGRPSSVLLQCTSDTVVTADMYCKHPLSVRLTRWSPDPRLVQHQTVDFIRELTSDTQRESHLRGHTYIPPSKAFITASYEHNLEAYDTDPITIVRSFDSDTLALQWTAAIPQENSKLHFIPRRNAILALGLTWNVEEGYSSAKTKVALATLDAASGSILSINILQDPQNPCGNLSEAIGDADLTPSGDQLVLVFGDGQVTVLNVDDYLENGFSLNSMHFFTASLATLAILVTPIVAGPDALRAVETYAGATSGKYIVKFKEGVSPKAWAKRLGLSNAVDWNIINGLASNLDTDSLSSLRASADVELISEDGIMHTMAIQEDAPWGLSRLSSLTPPAIQNADLLNFTYIYDAAAGEGVDIYIIDTGVYVHHGDFEDRARWGIAVGSYQQFDGHGHGTHVAGSAAGKQFGVAKKANIIAVKVLSDSGFGFVSDVVSGIDWVLGQVEASGRPSIASMSLGGEGISTALENAVASLTAAGIHVTVAAGNSNVDAANTSPARAPSAITVGSSTIADERALNSNYGPVVDVFAPGFDVISSWTGSVTATNTTSGTSMATAYIAGLVAYLISKEGNALPAEMETKIKAYALNGILSGIPTNTINALAHNEAPATDE